MNVHATLSFFLNSHLPLQLIIDIELVSTCELYLVAVSRPISIAFRQCAITTRTKPIVPIELHRFRQGA